MLPVVAGNDSLGVTTSTATLNVGAEHVTLDVRALECTATANSTLFVALRGSHGQSVDLVGTRVAPNPAATTPSTTTTYEFRGTARDGKASGTLPWRVSSEFSAALVVSKHGTKAALTLTFTTPGHAATSTASQTASQKAS